MYAISGGTMTSSTLRIDFEITGSNPNAPEWRDAHHYKCVLKFKRRQLTTYYSQGYGICKDPTAEGVLACLFTDASADDQSFEEWCADLGYNTDSRKAHKLYRLCCRTAEKLRNFLPDHADYTYWQQRCAEL